MKRSEKNPTGLLHPTLELRQLILNNPDLPLLVFAGSEANINGDHYYMSCSCVRACIGEFLDCSQQINDCCCYTDRDDFEDDLAEFLADDSERTDKEWDEYFKQALAKYEPYWKKCIILYVNN